MATIGLPNLPIHTCPPKKRDKKKSHAALPTSPTSLHSMSKRELLATTVAVTLGLQQFAEADALETELRESGMKQVRQSCACLP